MRIFIRVLLFLFLFSPSLLFSLNNDTAKVATPGSSFTKFYDQNQFEYDSTKSIDNSLYDFQKYAAQNNLGNNGLPLQDLSYSPFSSGLGFNYFRNNYRYYFFTPNKLKFYNTRTPYTNLFYVMGTKKEQMFSMTFSYNVKKNWNFTADFLRIRSDGIYVRQNTNDNSISLSTNYKSINNRYWLLGSAIYNGYKNSENGGIIEDSIFESGATVDKKLLDVNLTAAKRTTINGNVFLKQILNFGKKTADTAGNNVITPESRFILTSSFDANSIKYEDENPTVDFYPTIYYDSTKTSDSTFFYKIENELAWKRLDNNKHRGFIDLVGFGVSLKHQLNKIRQKETDTVLSNLIGGAELYNTYSKHSFWWNLSAKYVFNGPDNGDYNASLVLKKESRDSLNVLCLGTDSRLQSPDFIYNSYRSNHFMWHNNFDKTAQAGAYIYFRMKKYKLEAAVNFNNYTNILYFDNYAIAREYKGSVSVFSASLKKDFSFYNWHLNNKVMYQYVPDSTVIRLPEFALEHSLYYENHLFKKALLLQIGASVFYTSSYYANAYMPATGQFYLQDQKKYGNYPFVDFFINAQIKTVRIFFKVDHLNSGFTGNNYILTPGYPYADRTFKFGLSWKFFD